MNQPEACLSKRDRLYFCNQHRPSSIPYVPSRCPPIQLHKNRSRYPLPPLSMLADGSIAHSCLSCSRRRREREFSGIPWRARRICHGVCQLCAKFSFHDNIMFKQSSRRHLSERRRDSCCKAHNTLFLIDVEVQRDECGVANPPRSVSEGVRVYITGAVQIFSPIVTLLLVWVADLPVYVPRRHQSLAQGNSPPPPVASHCRHETYRPWTLGFRKWLFAQLIPPGTTGLYRRGCQRRPPAPTIHGTQTPTRGTRNTAVAIIVPTTVQEQTAHTKTQVFKKTRVNPPCGVGVWLGGM